LKTTGVKDQHKNKIWPKLGQNSATKARNDFAII